MKKVFIILIALIVAAVLYLFIDNALAKSYEVYSSYFPINPKNSKGHVKVSYKRKNEQELHFDNGVTLYRVFVTNNGRTLFETLTRQYGVFGEAFLSEAFYLILCPHKKHIVGIDMFGDKTGYTSFDLVQLQEYGNITTYRFAVEFDKYYSYSETIWLDLENDQYCGSYYFYPMPLDISEPTEEDKEFYAYMKDAFIGMSNDFVVDADKALDNYERRYWFPTNVKHNSVYYTYMNYISIIDKKNGRELLTKYEELEKRSRKLYDNDQFYNQTRLMLCSSPIWQIDDPDKDKDRSHLPLQGGLPKNEAELKTYLSWMEENVHGKLKQTEDAYNEPLKFEIEKEGLRVSSSGFDNKWNTADDQTFLSKYSEIDEMLSVNLPGRLL